MLRTLVLLPVMLELLLPIRNGWEMVEELLTPCFLTKDTAPTSLLELTTCGCKKLACHSNCSNPHAVLFDIGDESGNDSETKSD